VTLPTPLPQEPVLLPRRRFTQDEEPFVPRPTEEELREFLESIDDLQRTVDLWDKLSGIPGLLDTRMRVEIRRHHYGPGPHPGTGTPQSVHGGGSESKWDDPRDVRSFSDLREVSDVSLPPDDNRFEYFYHSFRWSDQVDAALADGLQVEGRRIYLSKDEIRDRGAGFAIVRIPKGQAKTGVDFVEPGLTYREWTVDSVPASDIIRVSREVRLIDSGGHGIPDYQLAAWAIDHQGEDVGDLPVEYRHWFSLPSIIQNARRLAEIFFDAADGVWRYVVAGRRVPDFRIRMGVERVANAVQRDLRDLTVRMVNGELSRAQWYAIMRETMKQEYRAAYLAAIGGKANYTRSEISKFGWRMRPHYRWLDNFLSELESGKQAMNGFAVMRAGMYARAANAIYQNTRARVAEQNGFREGRRKLGRNEEHCEDSHSRPGCIELAARDWVPMGELVPIGEATCLSHCLCELEFRK